MKCMGKNSRKSMAVLLSLCMLISGIPAGLSYAASITTIYAAAYKDAADVSDTTLPTTIDVNGQQTSVEWTWKENTFLVPYDTVEVTGTTQNGDTVKAQVEVIPLKSNELVYYIDASRDTGGESKAYTAVQELASTTLQNKVADQVYNDTDQWGRTGSNFAEKGTGNVDVTKKIQTGWYSKSKTTALSYKYHMEKGTYTLTAGFYEWWNGRSIKLALSGDGMEGVTSDTTTISGIGSSAVESVSFTVNQACTVTMEVQNATGGEAPVISWFSVAKGTVEIPEKIEPTEIVIDGQDVETAASNKNGLTYKGFGVLSGNSTSNLLMDYKQESLDAYNKMMGVLFGGDHPLIDHVKIEMGNDGNNSTGADSCTMRFENEEADASRSPGFQLAADAKKINTRVKVSFLRWSMPAWVNSAWNSDRTGAGYEAMYKWYKETIFDAYEKYNYIVDYVNPDTNETTNPDGDFIKWYKNRVTAENDFPEYMDATAIEAYHNIKIIASDENNSLNIVPSMRADKNLYSAVDAVGFHYRAGDETSTADYRTMADVDDKEVWYSEGCATFSYTEYQENKSADYGKGTIGGYQSPLAMADNFIKSFVYSRKTHYIFQPAIGSFYEGSQYDHKELLSAREPWAGYVHYDPAIYMLEHFTKFAVTGWENSSNTAGIWRVIPSASDNNSNGWDHLTNQSGNPSYLTLAAPDKSNFSIVMVNNSEKRLEYSIKAENMDLEAGAPMEIWETKTDSYLKYKGEAAYEDGYYTVTVEPYSMVTVTTLDCNDKEEYNNRLLEETQKKVLDTDEAGKELDNTNTILYADDFEYSGYEKGYLESRGNEPRYIVDYSGAFAVENGQLKQLLTTSVGQWNNYKPNCVVGDFRWMNYKASVDATVDGLGYAALNIREQTGMGMEGSGYNLQITANGTWTLKKRSTTLSTGTVKKSQNGTYNLALEGRGSFISAWIDGEEVATYLDSNPEYFGRVRLGCDWGETSFDNLVVEKVSGYMPYATKLVDNASDEVSYTGTWNIIAGGGGSSNDWYRSTSTTSTVGATIHFNMTGAGFALIGKNNGTASLDVVVDNKKIAENVSTTSSNQHCCAYMLKGFDDTSHEVTITVTSGTMVLDAIYFLPFRETDRTQLTELIEQATAISPDNYMDVTWNAFECAVSEAQTVLDTLDATQEAIDAAYLTLKAAMDGLLKGTSVVSAEDVFIAMYEGDEWNLPSNLTCTTAKGDTLTKEVSWDTEGMSAPLAYETVTVKGTIKHDGFAVTATIEVVPQGLKYFVDAGTGAGYYNKNTIAADSKPFHAVYALDKNLKNNSSDAAYSDQRGWGYVSDSTYKVSATIDGGDRPDSYIGTNKYSVGLRDKTSATQPMIYRFALDAGNYELTAGYHEFYGSGRSRDMQPSVTWTDSKGKEQEVKGNVVNLRSSNVKDSITFTLDKQTVVEYHLSYVSGEAAMYSWLGVSKIGEPAPNKIVSVIAPDVQAVASGQALQLPETVQVTKVDGTSGTAVVSWNTQGVDISTPYQSIVIDGVVEGTDLTTSVKVEVVPQTLIWFIDSGIDVSTQTTTQPYEAVKNCISGLKNEKADQAYVEGKTKWGYNVEQVNFKAQSNIDMTDKTASGLYAQGNGESASPIIYTLPMEAGDYNLHLAFHEWWQGPRIMNITASWTDAAGNEKNVLLGENVVVSSVETDAKVEGVVSLNTDTTLTVKIALASGTEAPVLSWLAVDKAITVDKSGLEKSVSEAAMLDASRYTADSFAAVTDALLIAQAVLADSHATKEAINAATKALSMAVNNLVLMAGLQEISMVTNPVDTSGVSNDAVVTVTMVSTASSAAIYYTLDNTVPSLQSKRYNAPVEVKTVNTKGETVIIKAIAVLGDEISQVVEKTVLFLPRELDMGDSPVGPVIATPTPKPTSIPSADVYQEGDKIEYKTDIFKEAAKEKEDVRVVVNNKEGKELYSWKFAGEDLANSQQKLSDVDLALSLEKAIEDENVSKLLLNGNPDENLNNAIVLNFNYEGVLPSQATVRIDVSNLIDSSLYGHRIYVYHFNTSTKKLENLPYSSFYKVEDDGYITMNILHCSDYVILPKKADSNAVASLRKQIKVTPGKKTLFVGKTKNIQIDLPQTLEMVTYLKDKTSSSAIGGVKVRYKSLNTKVASVDKAGKIKAKKKGSTTIITTLTLYNKKKITVKTTVVVKNLKK
ncbi:MAG: FN3 associated domain-containing protein [Velocimicrobium sp.]